MKRSAKQKAFTLIETMMALVILAMLMASVAVAFDASVKNFNANQGIYKTVNTGRQSLMRITNDIRNAQAVGLYGTDSGDDPDNSQCTILLNDGSNITYKYNSTDNTLYYITNDDESDSDYKLCENITAMTFNRTTVPDDSTAIRSVRISMTLTGDSGNNAQTLATASVIRKNL